MSSPRRLRRAVEALLADRRPRGFDADADEAAALQVAAALRAARPGADLPSAEYTARLERRLRQEADTPVQHRPGRRAVLRAAAGVAAAAAAGVAVDRLVVERGGGVSGLAGDAELVPDGGAWTRVASLADVRRGGALRFSKAGVEGVLVAREDGGIDGRSAVCTHLGCLLNVDAPQRRLACPCHRASFGYDGTPLPDEYSPGGLARLPALRTKVSSDTVLALLPDSATRAGVGAPAPSTAVTEGDTT